MQYNNQPQNQEQTTNQASGSLQPVLPGLNLSATKLYRVKSDGTPNVAHTSMIDFAEKKAQAEGVGIAQVNLKLNGNEFIYRLFGVDTNDVSNMVIE